MKKLLISLVLLSVTLAGCAKPQPKPQDTLSTFLDAFKASEITDYAEFFDGDTEGMQGNPFEFDDEMPEALGLQMMKLFQSYTYEIGEVTLEDDEAVVEVTFTGIDGKGFFQAWFTQYFMEAMQLALSGADEAAIEQLAVDLFVELSEELPTDNVITVDVEMVKVDEVWKIVLNEADFDLFDGMSGGLLSGLMEMNNSEDPGTDE
jgi:hypothetical protein